MTTTRRSRPPDDYRLLVPRDWFRIDLMVDRWRPQLKKFVDQQATRRQMSTDAGRELWASLRNAVETGVSQGALELYLRTDVVAGTGAPATLMVSLLPMRDALQASPEEFAQALRGREEGGATVSVSSLPAGPCVRVSTTTALDYYVEMPGGAGYILLSFTVPLSGVQSPLGELCEAMAGSLRWIHDAAPQEQQ
ncbi:hypothetical protein [Streptomyces rubrogriseus]|uniref:Uncharacterized protein n=1 Tax=Streptomyces rubrogriseus TaxID=194673 RepID=A0A6G3TPE8_9ACTN|nr:hypothetical protein [Streptomyces rubrogriseus]NEC38600.1 hypothetical protein [Streptomyces rubrogriseus]